MIELRTLKKEEYDDFIKRNQAAFMVAAAEKFGLQDKEVISREDIMRSLTASDAEAFNIICGGKTAGGAVIQIDDVTHKNSLDLLFIDPAMHGKGIGGKVWRLIEEMYPETVIWETHTPYFEIRNIHFYVNKCGFHIVEFYNPQHPDIKAADTPGGELFFRFEKTMGR